jgi:hypothetical protein
LAPPRQFRTLRLRWTQLCKYSIIITGVAIIITLVDITTMGGGGTINPVGTTTIGVIIITVSRRPAAEQRQGVTLTGAVLALVWRARKAL